MKNEFNEIVKELSELLESDTYDILTKNMQEEEDTGLLINITLSAHISSLMNCINNIAVNSSGNEAKAKVNKFINQLTVFISGIEGMKMEKI